MKEIVDRSLPHVLWIFANEMSGLGCIAQPMLTHMPESSPANQLPEPAARGWTELVGTGVLLGTVHVLTGPDHLSALLTLSGLSP